MSIRAGYHVAELMWIEETAFGSIPQAGTWNHFGDAVMIDPRLIPTHKSRVGLGRVIEKDFIKTKEYAELVANATLLAKDAVNGYEWIDILNYAMGVSAPAAIIDLEKTTASLCIGAKLDLATDEFETLVGCKINRYELGSEVDGMVELRLGAIAQGYTYNTTDYKQGLAVRATFPTTDPIKHSDIDLEIAAGSIHAALQRWSMRLTRDIEKKGSKTGEATKYGAFYEEKVTVELEIVRDFDSTTQLTQFLNNTKFNAEISIPTGIGGRKLTLSDGRWITGSKPARELELIGLTLTGKFCDLAVTTL